MGCQQLEFRPFAAEVDLSSMMQSCCTVPEMNVQEG